MAKNIKRTTNGVAGGMVRYLNDSTPRSSGQLAVFGSRVVLLAKDAAASEADVPAFINGVEVLYAKLSTDDVAQGVPLYFDAGNNRLTLVASTHKLAGIAAAASGAGATTVLLLLGELVDTDTDT